LPPEFSESSRTGNFALETVGHEDLPNAHEPARAPGTDTTAVLAPLVGSRDFRVTGSTRARGSAPQDVPGIAIEALEDGPEAQQHLAQQHLAQQHLAADVLNALSDLVSASTDATAEKGLSFTGLARSLEALEARLQNVGRLGDAVALKRAMGQIEAQFLGPATVDSGQAGPAAEARDCLPEPVLVTLEPASRDRACTAEGSTAPAPSVARSEVGGTSREQNGEAGESPLGIGREHLATGQPPSLEIDAHIRNLTLRMAAVHRDALRRGAAEAGAGRTCGAETCGPGPLASEHPVSSPCPGAEAVSDLAAPAFELSYETRAGLSALLRRLETKIDALARTSRAEPASAADRHQADLLARRIESTELQLTKRLDAGFAAAAIEMRAVEDMLRALAARCEAQGDLGGALGRLERSVDSIRERLDRIEEQIASTRPVEHAIDLGHGPGSGALAAPSGTEDQASRTGPRSARATDAIGDARHDAREPVITSRARDESGRRTRAPIDAIAATITLIADRLRCVETHLSSTCSGFTGESARGDGRPPVLPWLRGRAKQRHDTRRGRAACSRATFGHNDDKTRDADPGQGGDPDTLIEPGSGFTPLLETHALRTTLDPGLDGDEGSNGRTDFIEAARRAVRAAQGTVEPRLADEAHAAPRAQDGLGAKARRFARIVRNSILPG
jgi:hypothetical protein